jgi:hypothetical protein
MYLRSKKIYISELFVPLTDFEIKTYYKWIKNGLYYGYPVCCIVSFIQNFTQGFTQGNYKAFSSRKHIELLDGQGYIPCNVCNSKLASGLSIHKLLVNRKHHNLFPNDKKSRS